MDNNQMYHWGIKGMKWGVRRFQNKDGTRTALGKKRERANDKAESDGKKEPAKSGPKKVSDMSNDELQTAIKRLQLEQQYRQLKPERVSIGKQFMEKSILPAAMEGGKRLLTDFLIDRGKKALGLGEDVGKNEVDLLKKQVEKLNLQKQLKDLTKDNSVKEKVEQLNLQKQLKELTKDNTRKEWVEDLNLQKQLRELMNYDFNKEKVSQLKTEYELKRYTDLLKDMDEKKNKKEDD